MTKERHHSIVGKQWTFNKKSWQPKTQGFDTLLQRFPSKTALFHAYNLCSLLSKPYHTSYQSCPEYIDLFTEWSILSDLPTVYSTCSHGPSRPSGPKLTNPCPTSIICQHAARRRRRPIKVLSATGREPSANQHASFRRSSGTFLFHVSISSQFPWKKHCLESRGPT